MRNKLIKKLTIVGLAAIFLLSMSSYGPAQKGGKGGKGGKEPPELYKVTMSIIGDNPGIENLDMPGNIPVCGSPGYFYAEKEKGNFILGISSKGRETPGPADTNYEVAPLNMWVNTGIGDIDHLENCLFMDDQCHRETDSSPGWIFIYILRSYDGDGENEDIQIRWCLDNTKVESGKKKSRGREWHLYSLLYSEATYSGQYVISTNPNPPEGLSVGGPPWVTDVSGPFVLHHSGIACDGPEDMYNRQVLEDFNIRLTIQRVR